MDRAAHLWWHACRFVRAYEGSHVQRDPLAAVFYYIYSFYLRYVGTSHLHGYTTLQETCNSTETLCAVVPIHFICGFPSRLVCFSSEHVYQHSYHILREKLLLAERNPEEGPHRVTRPYPITSYSSPRERGALNPYANTVG